MIKTDFRFWNVGHGGFFTEIVSIDGKDFSYVYDCGTIHKKKYIEKRVLSFINSLKNRGVKVLDLIVISHIDTDHIKGLNFLLVELKKNNISVKYVALPYLEDVMKLFLLKRYYRTSRWIRHLISDPKSYLERMINENVKVILKRPGDYSGEDSYEVDDFGPSHSDLEKITSFGYGKGKDVRWKLSLFQKQMNQDFIENFKNEVADKFSSSALNSMKEDSRLRATTKDKISKLREIYKDTLKETNDTSICLRSAYYLKEINRPIGIILTGDCPIAECWQDFNKKFLSDNFFCVCYQLSHHGSASAWRANGGSQHLDMNQINLDAFYYISFSNATELHIAPDVKDHLLENRKTIIELSLKSRFEYFPNHSCREGLYFFKQFDGSIKLFNSRNYDNLVIDEELQGEAFSYIFTDFYVGYLINQNSWFYYDSNNLRKATQLDILLG